MAQMNTFGKRIAGMACASFMVTALVAQMYVNKEWAETTGLPDDIDWTATALDNEGNILVVGNTLQSPGNPDVLISKYSRDGELIWQRTYGGNAEAQDYGVAVATDISGNCFVAGTVTNTGSSLDIAVLKYNAAGDLLWHTEWNGPSNLYDAPSSVALDPAGNIYVAGTTYGSPTNPNYALLKLDPNGSLQWASSYDYAGFPDVATGISFDQGMDPVVTGGSATAADAWDYATVRYNKQSGTQSGLNRVNVPGVGLDNALAFTRSAAGDLYITGYREVNGEKDIQTVKLNNTFTLAWVVNYDGEGLADEGRAIGADNGGNVYVAGRTDKANGGSDFITIKYGPNGDILWKQRYQAKKDIWMAEANKLAVTMDGGVIVVGTIFDGESKNFMTVKYSADGKLEWEKEYNGLEGDDKGLGLLVGNDGKIYVTGVSGAGGSSATYTTVKYSSFKKDNGIVYDQNGEAYCVDRELIIKLRPNVVNHDVVNDNGWEYGELEKVIGADLTAQIEDKLGHVNGQKPLLAFKVFLRLKTTDQISISRLGEEEQMYEHWSTFLLTIPSPLDIMAARDSLSTMPEVVEYAEPNYLRTFLSLPNDPLLNSQACLVPSSQYPYASINIEPAWDIQKGQDYVKVGILDHPIYWAHEEFGDGTYSGSKLNSGWSWPNNAHISNIDHPDNSHGTACAGIVGAFSNNGIGMSGIAGGDVDGAGNKGVLVTSLGIASANGFVASGVIASAIVEGSVDMPGYGYALDVQNASFGGGPSSTTEYNAIKTCVKNACVFVAARGNDGNSDWIYPACYRDAYVLNVGASGTDGEYMSTSNGDVISSSWGGDMDLIAPGTIHIVPSTVDEQSRFNFAGCTVPGNYYDCFRGTSSAAPHAAGVAALMMSEHNVENGAPNNLAPEDVEFLMQRYATDLGAGWYDPLTGWGRLDAGNVMQHLDFPRYRVFHSGTPSASSTQVVGGSALFNIPAGYGLAAGLYYAEKVQLTQLYNDVFPSTTQVLDGWGRLVSTIGITTNFPSASDDNGLYTFTLSGNQANVVAQTYTWHVTSTFGGSLVSAWIPYTPSQLRTAYSLHLYDATMTGIEEFVNNNSLVVYPSPTESVLYIRADLASGGSATIRIFDATGRLVYEHLLRSRGNAPAEIPVGGLSYGTYTVQLLTPDRILTSRFVKQ